MFQSGNFVNHIDSRLLAMLLLVWRFQLGCVEVAVRLLSMFAGQEFGNFKNNWNCSSTDPITFMAIRCSSRCTNTFDHIDRLAIIWLGYLGSLPDRSISSRWPCRLCMDLLRLPTHMRCYCRAGHASDHDAPGRPGTQWNLLGLQA